MGTIGHLQLHQPTSLVGQAQTGCPYQVLLPSYLETHYIKAVDKGLK